MPSRWQIAAITSAVSAWLLVRNAPQYSLHNSFAWTFIPLLLTQWLAFATWTAIIYPKLLSPLRHLPHPTGGSFINGQFWDIVNEPNGIPMRRWINEIPNDGLIRYNYLFNKERLLITSPAALGEVLVQKSYEFVKPTLLREAVGTILGVGILVAEGEEHKIQRKHLMPAFAYRHIKELYPTFWTKAGEMVDLVTSELQSQKTTEQKSESPGEVDGDGKAIFPFGYWLNRVTLDIIGIAGMGYNFNALHDPDTPLAVTYRKLFAPSRQAAILGIVNLFLPRWFLKWIPIRRNEELYGGAQTIRKVSREVIDEKKRVMQEKGKRGEKDVDILGVAFESGGFTEDNLVDQMMTFLAAGHETTASSMNWALIVLCQHPDMQTRLREEIRANLPSISDKENPMSAEVLDKLPYLHAVCNEVLRVWSPVSLTRREALKDTTLVGQFVPKGTDIILSPSAVNLSKELWGDDALEFKPERWMGPKRANNGGAVSNYALLSFLHGPRSCIGQAFAKAEFACLLAAVIGRFEIALEHPEKEVEIESSGLTTRPKGGLNLRMKIVEGW